MARLRSKIWVQAYLKRLELQTIAAYVIAHGDDHSGAILVKISICKNFGGPRCRNRYFSRKAES